MGVAGKDKTVDMNILLSYDVPFSELFFLLYNTPCKHIRCLYLPWPQGVVFSFSQPVEKNN